MGAQRFSGRLKPYTDTGISRVPCSRCDKPSQQQWQVCANGNRYLGVCSACDVELNRRVLEFFKVQGRVELLKRYKNGL